MMGQVIIRDEIQGEPAALSAEALQLADEMASVFATAGSGPDEQRSILCACEQALRRLDVVEWWTMRKLAADLWTMSLIRSVPPDPSDAGTFHN